MKRSTPTKAPRARPSAPPRATRPARTPRTASAPLGPDPREVERALDRLGAEMSRCIDHLPGPIDGPRGLARAINADVTVCQRVLNGLRGRGSAADRLAQWPGASGVRLVADRVRAVLPGRAGAGSLGLAVDAYERLIKSIATSHAKAVRTLRAHEARASTGAATQTDAVAGVEHRRSLSRAAADLLGYSMEASTFVVAVRPLADRPELMEGCSAVSLIGLRSLGARVCVTSQNTQLRQFAGDLAGEVRWTPLGSSLTKGGRDGVLTDFCTSPLPLSAVDDGDGVIRQVVEPADLPIGGRGADIVLARHWSPDNNPQFTPSPSWSQIFRLRHPCRRMAMDVYMHRSMLSAAPPAVGAYYWHPALPSDPRKNWNDRLPTQPAVALLNPLAPAQTSAWSRHAELTARLFEMIGWPAEQFVGFRCEEAFPIWGAAYYLTFDLAPAAG